MFGSFTIREEILGTSFALIKHPIREGRFNPSQTPSKEREAKRGEASLKKIISPFP
jgi:hypothetical protein